MKTRCLIILLLLAGKMQAQKQFQLAPPLLKYQTIFFDSSLSVPLLFEQPGAQIRYTTDQSVPHKKSTLYTGPVQINAGSTTLKARAFADHFTPSEVVEATFIRTGIAAVVGFPLPGSGYKGSGANTLHDNRGGNTDHTKNTWLGYSEDSIVFTVENTAAQPVRAVLFNVLQNQAAWICFPAKAVVYAFNETSGNFATAPCGTINIPVAENPAVLCKAFQVPLSEPIASRLKLVLYTSKLPQGHQGAGKNAWLFIDELKLY